MEKDNLRKNPTGKTTLVVMEEELKVGKRAVETGVLRVRKDVHTTEQLVEEPLMREALDVQRVSVNRFIDNPVETRTDGEVTIIPVMEEVLVVEKKLRLKEELHITRRKDVVTHRQKEVVRKEEAVVERAPTEH